MKIFAIICAAIGVAAIASPLFGLPIVNAVSGLAIILNSFCIFNIK